MKQHLKSCIMFKGLLRFSKTRELRSSKAN